MPKIKTKHHKSFGTARIDHINPPQSGHSINIHISFEEALTAPRARPGVGEAELLQPEYHERASGGGRPLRIPADPQPHGDRGRAPDE
jgi:hypothetical protein